MLCAKPELTSSKIDDTLIDKNRINLIMFLNVVPAKLFYHSHVPCWNSAQKNKKKVQPTAALKFFWANSKLFFERITETGIVGIT